MEKIKIGHLIRVFDKEGFTYEGVVIGIEDHMDQEFLQYVSYKIYNAAEKEPCMVCAASPYYKEGDLSIIYLREVDMHHVEKLYSEYHRRFERPDDIVPNKNYNNGIEVYVKTKKNWFSLLRTTAKMAFFDGGRCSLSNITDIRRKQ